MKSLATKYRPIDFEEVCGQEAIKKILSKQIELKQFNNCYLFCGPSGCGKTTIARIFAYKINEYTDASGNLCSSEPLEIDGASNNGVENVRELVRTASERSLDGTYKVIIIDECHALTNQAWQAFLKCIEEPPKYTIFIFCTTDPQKLPATILNRMMRFNFTRLKTELINDNLLNICAKENLANYTDACSYIARISNGGMRDAISLLDKCAQYSTDLSMNNVLNAIGYYSYDLMFKLVNATIDGNESVVLTCIEEVYQTGTDLKLFIDQYTNFILNITKYIIFKSIEMTTLPSTVEQDLLNATNFDNPRAFYNYLINKLADCKAQIKTDMDLKSTIEIYLLQACRLV